MLALGFLLFFTALRVKSFERTVVVKGLSEREYPADVVIWPIQFTRAGNDAAALYASVEEDTSLIREFLMARGVTEEEITLSPPSVTDKSLSVTAGRRLLPLQRRQNSHGLFLPNRKSPDPDE